MPRSLNEPVGLAPSSFSQTLRPTRSDSRGAAISGVPPSSRRDDGGGPADGEVVAVLLDHSPPGDVRGSTADHPDQPADAPDGVETGVARAGRPACPARKAGWVTNTRWAWPASRSSTLRARRRHGGRLGLGRVLLHRADRERCGGRGRRRWLRARPGGRPRTGSGSRRSAGRRSG